MQGEKDFIGFSVFLWYGNKVGRTSHDRGVRKEHL